MPRTRQRISFTYRKVTHLVPIVELTSTLETHHVRKVYDEIAQDFSRTRYNLWPKVKEFIDTLPANTLVVDVGCGNGKYLNALTDSGNRVTVASDFSNGLINVCKDMNREAHGGMLVSDCLKSPLRDNIADAAISIAVVHHMTSESRRIQAFTEILRILKPGGRALVTAWAFEQENTNYVDRVDKQNDASCDEPQKFLPVHQARTAFKSADLLVPWKLQGKTFHRFYHVFKNGEMEDIFSKIPDGEIENVFYDDGNWC